MSTVGRQSRRVPRARPRRRWPRPRSRSPSPGVQRQQHTGSPRRGRPRPIPNRPEKLRGRAMPKVPAVPATPQALGKTAATAVRAMRVDRARPAQAARRTVRVPPDRATERVALLTATPTVMVPTAVPAPAMTREAGRSRHRVPAIHQVAERTDRNPRARAAPGREYSVVYCMQFHSSETMRR